MPIFSKAEAKCIDTSPQQPPPARHADETNVKNNRWHNLGSCFECGISLYIQMMHNVVQCKGHCQHVVLLLCSMLNLNTRELY